MKNRIALMENNDKEYMKYFNKNNISWEDISEMNLNKNEHKSSIFKNARIDEKIEEITNLNIKTIWEKENIEIDHQSIQKFDHEPIRCAKIISSKNFNAINNYYDYNNPKEVKIEKQNKNQSLLANISK